MALTAYGTYGSSLLCLLLAALQYHPVAEINFWSLVWSVPLVLLAAYFLAAAKMKSGDFVILRSTKESSRDIWILRSGTDEEVDLFLSELRTRLSLGGKEARGNLLPNL